MYYTPAYIVDYIVGQTVGRQIEGKSPAQLAGRKDKANLSVFWTWLAAAGHSSWGRIGAFWTTA